MAAIETKTSTYADAFPVVTIPTYSVLKPPEPSKWSMKILDITYRPRKENTPSAWVRFWMRVFFGCIWTKDK